MATIGVDITPLQGPHRFRGVGSVVINVLQNISNDDAKRHNFVLFMYDDGESEKTLDLINASRLKTQVRYVPDELPGLPKLRSRAGLKTLLKRIRRQLIDRSIGTKRITDLDDIDTFLQFEQDILPPRKKGMPITVVAYDLIPYILEASYLWNYRTARFNHGYSRRAAVLTELRRRRYLQKIKQVSKRADKLVAISKHTKQDFIRYARVPAKKIDVTYLGVDAKQASKQLPNIGMIRRYNYSTWGDIEESVELPDVPFLLFVGGIDPRRQLTELVAAFNQLRARGIDIKLVLAGDTMYGPVSLPNHKLGKAIIDSSYRDDIYMLGFVDLPTREWLYQHALAFVYPSLYEGFGLPILEAMNYGTPVITYANSSIKEISSDAALYASTAHDIVKFSMELISDSNKRKLYSQKGKQQTSMFKWTATAVDIIKNLE